MSKIIIFSSLLKLVNRSTFNKLVNQHNANKWRKGYLCWSHFIVLMYQQITGKQSLRALVTAFNTHQPSHYHLGIHTTLKKSTVADANKTIPNQVFLDLLNETIQFAKRQVRMELKNMIRIIDATPIQLRSTFYNWAKTAHRIVGLKCHTIFDPISGLATHFSLSDANVNDITAAKGMALEKGATYVFDKAYCCIEWWNKLSELKCRLITRLKKNAAYEVISKNEIKKESTNILSDEVIKFTSSKGKALNFLMRKITALREEDNNKVIIVTNDLESDAAEIAELYKMRWQIEIFFKWLKQNLKIKKYLGHTENAVKNQIYVALITYTLIFIYKSLNRLKYPASVILLIISEKLFSRRPLQDYLNPSTAKIENVNYYQMELALC
jgi:putative transposase